MRKIAPIILTFIFIFSDIGYSMQETTIYSKTILRAPLSFGKDKSVKVLLDSFLDYLISYTGNALTLVDFVKDINAKEPSLINRMGKSLQEQQETVVNFLQRPETARMVEKFSPNTLRFISVLRAKAILKNWKAQNKNIPLLGNLYFKDEVFWPMMNFLFSFYHPVTKRPYVLCINPQEQDLNKAVFWVYADFPTGKVPMGFTIGRFGEKKLELKGDIPAELADIIVFIQSRYQGCYRRKIGFSYVPDYETDTGNDRTYDMSYSYNFWGRDFKEFPGNKEVVGKFYRGQGGTGGKICLECEGEKLEVNLTPITQNDSEVELDTIDSDAELDLFWRNNWKDDAMSADYKLPEVLEDIEAEHRIGNRILELGGKNRPSSSIVFKDKKIVSFDRGAPDIVLADEGMLFVRGNVEDFDNVSGDALEIMAKFLEFDPALVKQDWVSVFNTVVISNLLNYVDARKVAYELGRRLKPGSLVVIQNSITDGSKEAFSRKGVKSNKDLLGFFTNDGFFEISRIYGYKPAGGGGAYSNTITISKEQKGLIPLNYKDALNFDGYLYLVLICRDKKGNSLGLNLAPGTRLKTAL